MKVKTVDDLFLIRKSSIKVLDQIGKLILQNLKEERKMVFPAKIETTNAIVKRYLKKGVIKRSINGGKVTRKNKYY